MLRAGSLIGRHVNRDLKKVREVLLLGNESLRPKAGVCPGCRRLAAECDEGGKEGGGGEVRALGRMPASWCTSLAWQRTSDHVELFKTFLGF